MEKNSLETIERSLWTAADKLRKNMDAAEYKHVVLGLIFLKYISDSFEKMRAKLMSGAAEYVDADPDDPYEYMAENVFYVPEKARWSYLQSRAKLPSIGKDVDTAMELIEAENDSLRGVLPKEYAKEKLDKQSLGGLIDKFSSVTLVEDSNESGDLLGRVYEYFLGQFALAEGKKGGQFYTPRCLVELLVNMLEPYSGRVFDPCCGSGGMFVQSERFIEAHGDRYREAESGFDQLFNSVVSVFGQESNQTTWRLCKMNLAMRGIDSTNIKWNNEGSFLKDLHKDLRADFIIANPPFNDGDWGGESLSDPARWPYGIPPASNANYAWIQHFVTHLAPAGRAGFLLATKALASESKVEKGIRRKLIEDNLVECIVLLPGKLFYSTPAPVSLWVLGKGRNRNGTELLFIDGSRDFVDLDRTHRILDDKLICKISDVYHLWRSGQGYEDIPGYCKSVDKRVVLQSDCSLYPGAYIGVNEASEDIKDPEESRKRALSSVDESFLLIEEMKSDMELIAKLAGEKIGKGKILLEEYVLSDVLEESDDVLGEAEEPEILSITENAGLVLQRERFSKRVAKEDTSKYKLVRRGDIVYNPYLLWAGAIDQCNLIDEGITSPAYAVFRVREGFEPNLVGHLLKSSYMKKWYWNISIGTHERRRTAPPEKFLELKVQLPDFELQAEIAGLYAQVLEERELASAAIRKLDVLSKSLSEFITGR